jgi:starvation-inducible DNA-binding protein
VATLNLLLANYHVHYQKLRNFHWNVEGADFFELHEQFEQEYTMVHQHIDEIAERIRIFGKKPVSNFSDYLSMAEIKEPKQQLRPYEMVKEVVDDFEQLLSFMMDCIDAAGEIGDTGTVDMVTAYIRKMEKAHWMYTSWLKEV